VMPARRSGLQSPLALAAPRPTHARLSAPSSHLAVVCALGRFSSTSHLPSLALEVASPGRCIRSTTEREPRSWDTEEMA
jgi:hypothetical protein